MSEEERILNYLKNPQNSKIRRIVTFTALLIGITTVLSGLLRVPFFFWANRYPQTWPEDGDVDILLLILCTVCWPLIRFWYVVGTGLGLSTVMFFIERDKHFRLLPLKLVLTGIMLYTAILVLVAFTEVLSTL
jgi:hypothetical protein